MQRTIELAAEGSESLLRWLQNHPHVQIKSFTHSHELSLRWNQADWQRMATAGKPEYAPNYGLIELMDNNPLVCADTASVPGPEATLSLIALGPVVRAGFEIEALSAEFNFAANEAQAQHEFEMMRSAVIQSNAGSTPQLLGLECLFRLISASVDDLRAIFDESYARSFFVRHVPALVEDRVLGSAAAECCVEPREQEVCIRVIADRDGKCGAAQVVHLFNVMAGFEESLGLGGV